MARMAGWPRGRSPRGKSGLHEARVPGNARRGQPQGKRHREETAAPRGGKGETVGQEPTAERVTGPARQAPPGAMPNRGLARGCTARMRPAGTLQPERPGLAARSRPRGRDQRNGHPRGRPRDRIRLTGHPRILCRGRDRPGPPFRPAAVRRLCSQGARVKRGASACRGCDQPAERVAAEQVQVEMFHLLAGVAAGVGDGAVTARPV